MDKNIINLQTKRVEAENALLSSKVATAVEKLEESTALLVQVALALEELHGAIGDPETPD